MTRFPWAWTEACALAYRAVRGAGKRTRRGRHGCGNRSWIVGALKPSFIRPTLVLATGALVVGAMPAAALASSSRVAHPKFSNRKSRTIHSGRGHEAAHLPRSRADGRSIGVLGGRPQLSPGAGYGSANGSSVVRALQVRLARAGDRPGPIDGRYGPLTQQAVRRFQAAHGLSVDGIAGPVTLTALTSPTPVLYPGAGYGLGGGSTSVRALQRALGRLGFSPGPVDGRYGPRTIRAVERFQRAHGLEPGKVVGARTERALSTSEGRRMPLKHSTHGRLREHRPVSHTRGSRPTPPHKSVHRAARSVGRLPPLPVTLLLLGLAIMGLGVAMLSYERARAKARRARGSDSWPGPVVTPPFPADSRGSNGSLVGAAEESER